MPAPLICSLCGLPIESGTVEWVNHEGELRPFHSGQRYDPDACAYIARHSKEYRNNEFFLTKVVRDSK